MLHATRQAGEQVLTDGKVGSELWERHPFLSPQTHPLVAPVCLGATVLCDETVMRVEFFREGQETTHLSVPEHGPCFVTSTWGSLLCSWWVSKQVLSPRTAVWWGHRVPGGDPGPSS